jgi:hypothetical protein
MTMSEPIEVSRDKRARASLMRRVERYGVCAWCAGERVEGGVFRYGWQTEGGNEPEWQRETFCSPECRRAYRAELRN